MIFFIILGFSCFILLFFAIQLLTMQQIVREPNPQIENSRSNPYGLNATSTYETQPVREQQPSNQALLQASGFRLEQEKVTPLTIVLTSSHMSNLMIKEMSKLKVYTKSEINGLHRLKIEIGGTFKMFLMQIEECQKFAISCFWLKLNNMNIKSDCKEEFINSCDGDVFKKSYFMKVWEPCYLLITAKDGLMSFRGRNEGEIAHIEKISELWSRFELIEGGRYIVLKFWHGIFKYEFAVPVNRSVKWFKAFYSLLIR